MKLSLLSALLFCATAWSQTGFDESQSDRLRIITNGYELALSKTNGAIVGLIDKRAHAEMTLGSRNGCLWGANFQTPGVFRGGCGADSYGYRWTLARLSSL